MIVQGRTRTGQIGRVDVLLDVRKTSNGWSQRFIRFVDENCLDPLEGSYLNVDYISHENVKHLMNWWKCDFVKFRIKDEEDNQFVHVNRM